MPGHIELFCAWFPEEDFQEFSALTLQKTLC